MTRNATLVLFAILAILSLTVAEDIIASAIIKPSVPQFTVGFEAYPYYVPPEYGIDPYTGANITVRQGYTVKNESMVFTIKVQQFTPYIDADGHEISLSCSIRGKGHYEPDWKEFGHYQVSPGSEYLVQSYAFEGNGIPNIGYVPNGGQVDYQVEARIGYYTYEHADCYDRFTGEASGWSPTLTLTIGENTTPTVHPTTWPTPHQTATPSPNEGNQLGIGQTEIVFLAIIAFVFGAGLSLLIYLVKRK